MMGNTERSVDTELHLGCLDEKMSLNLNRTNSLKKSVVIE